jgi:hypothetical protein
MKNKLLIVLVAVLGGGLLYMFVKKPAAVVQAAPRKTGSGITLASFDPTNKNSEFGWVTKELGTTLGNLFS